MLVLFEQVLIAQAKNVPERYGGGIPDASNKDPKVQGSPCR
jgi:hypothetical protein